MNKKLNMNKMEEKYRSCAVGFLIKSYNWYSNGSIITPQRHMKEYLYETKHLSKWDDLEVNILLSYMVKFGYLEEVGNTNPQQYKLTDEADKLRERIYNSHFHPDKL